ncbi:MAG: acetyl-CoA carboxylase biotin carboxyl carrier protein, partial [Alkalispirochaeta sp.]
TLKKNESQNPVYTQPIVVHPQAMQSVTSVQDGGGNLVPQAPPVQPATSAAPTPEQSTPASATAAGEGASARDLEVIASPIVGTFYRSPSPDSPAFCQEGDIVEKGKTICILEAMKVMNELEAEFTMEIVSFKVNNGDMVEYGTPIVEVRRV